MKCPGIKRMSGLQKEFNNAHGAVYNYTTVQKL